MMEKKHLYFVIYKPYGMLSQFSPDKNKPLLGELHDFPKDVYPVGRLDHDSEGLLILTNDKKLFDRLLNPRERHERTYLVQVDGKVTERAIQDLQKGMEISVEGKPYFTRRAIAKAIEEPENLPPRNPPVRYRAAIPTSWLELTLTEGKNRQVRRMTAKTGHPTLRLIRRSIEDLVLPEFIPGKVWEYNKQEIYQLLKLNHH